MLFEWARRRVKTGLESVKAAARLGNYWYWLAADQELEIKPLVYPLRYDILIRKDYFSFYLKNRSLYQNDFSAYLASAKNHDYYLWFTRVAIPKAAKSLRENPLEIEKAFVRRIRKSAALYDQMEEQGFNEQYPIVPHTAEVILPTVTGKVTKERYFMGDGCHRLACLMSMGYKKLPKGYYRIKCFREFAPLDNTSLLLGELREELNWPDEYSANAD